MNQPTPAIVAQSAVRRLPRVALLLVCAAYVLPGFFGRGPWKNAEAAAFGYMLEMAQGRTSWLAPTLLGQPPETEGLLAYWTGAAAIRLLPWLPADLAARLPFVLLLALTLAATWYAAYNLARTPRAQPVPFAFGGEAQPKDYARAIADGCVLALVATLGLAQLGHETTPALAQLACTALAFHGLAALPFRPSHGWTALVLGLTGLTLGGAPTLAMLFALGGAGLAVADRTEDAPRRPWAVAAGLVGGALALAALAHSLNLWRWRIEPLIAHDGTDFIKLMAWFTWPAGAMAMWTLWQWRRQLGARHVAQPLWFAGVAMAATVLTHSADRSLLLALPALAALAAFALPTLQRSLSALIDWFAVLFFSGCALIIWIIWLSLQTGLPPQPAANVARLAPGFTPSFSLLATGLAAIGTLAWGWLVAWRVGRHRAALWKSLVLPAGGAVLGWLLVMTLWLPVLDYARSYQSVTRSLAQSMTTPGCIETLGLSRGQLATLRLDLDRDLVAAGGSRQCPWLVVASDLQPATSLALAPGIWQPVTSARRPTDARDNLLLFQRRAVAR